MKRTYVSMLVLMMSSVAHATDTDASHLSGSCTQECATQSDEKPGCDSLNRFTVNCLKTTGGVTVGTFLTVVAGPVQIEPFTAGVLQSNASGVISSTNGTVGQILSVSPVTSAPAWTTLTSSDSSVLITISPNSINFQVSGGGGSGNVVGPASSTQNAVVLFANTTGKLIQQSANNGTTALPVTIDGATNMSNINNLSITANFNIPNTTDHGTNGVITVGSSSPIPLIHTFGVSRSGSPANIFVGANAGSLNTSAGSDNAGFGAFALQNIVTGTDNTALGFQALSNCTGGSNTIAIGSGAGRAIVNGSSGIYIGADASSDETGIIRIGAASHSALFIGGANGVVAGTSPIISRVVVTSFSTNQVGINSATPVSIDDSGNVTNANTLTFIGGDVTSPFGTINLPATSPAVGGLTPGTITQENTFLLHSGSPDGTDIYVGQSAGNVPLPAGSGLQNAGVGVNALANIASGVNNSALGFASLSSLASGTDNSAVGFESLLNCTGSNNIALGSGAGGIITTGNSGIYIGADASSGAESSTMRIGTHGVHSSCFIAGIAGITTTVADAIPVLISSSTAQLGTASSSARYKKDIKAMESVAALLMKLRPVRFRYKIHDDRVAPEYGLIAEEVAQILPDLVIYKDGQPETVKYHLLPALLIKALQEVIAKNEEQDAEIAEYKKQLALLLERIELLEQNP